MADTVRSGFKPPREVDWLNAHSVWTQPMHVEYALDVQCGQAESDSDRVRVIVIG